MFTPLESLHLVKGTVHFVSGEELFQEIGSHLVIAVGGQESPWGTTPNPAGSH